MDLPAVLGHQVVKNDRELVQPGEVSRGQLLQDPVARLGQADSHHAAVVRVTGPFDQSRRRGAVHELHGAVRAQQQVACQLADGGREVAGVSLDRHQQLMLDVRNALGLGLVFAPALEAPQRHTELK
ncbi:MAG: hypothetical protein WAK76_21165 [Trebonia sp.]